MRRLAALLLLVGTIPAGAGARANPIVDVPVAFNVVNVNDSLFQCAGSDGKPYVVRGWLVAPQSLLSKPNRAVTLYLHGATVGGFQWHFRELRSRGYDAAWTLARRGRASVVIDLLGYGDSGHPNGKDLCTGTEAAIAHQVVTALRNGAYLAGGKAGLAFRRVAIAGQSWGGLVAQIEAYSYHDVDAFVMHGMNNQPVTIVHALPLFGPFELSCAQGGDGGTGYAYSWPDPELEKLDATWRIDPDVWAALKARIMRDPCGNTDSNGDAFFDPDQQLHIGEIDVPVLLVAGELDAMVGPTDVTMPLQKARLTSSPDVGVVIIQDQGHAGQFEPTHDALIGVIESWLSAHGL